MIETIEKYAPTTHKQKSKIVGNRLRTDVAFEEWRTIVATRNTEKEWDFWQNFAEEGASLAFAFLKYLLGQDQYFNFRSCLPPEQVRSIIESASRDRN